MIKQIYIVEGDMYGLSDNGELYIFKTNFDRWSHVTKSPDDREQPYLDIETISWKNRKGTNS